MQAPRGRRAGHRHQTTRKGRRLAGRGTLSRARSGTTGQRHGHLARYTTSRARQSHSEEVLPSGRDRLEGEGARREEADARLISVVPRRQTAELQHHLRSGSLAGGPLLFPGRPLMLEVS